MNEYVDIYNIIYTRINIIHMCSGTMCVQRISPIMSESRLVNTHMMCARR